MKNLFNLQEVEFVSTDMDAIEKEAIANLEKELGKTLYPASPERILLLSLLPLIIQLRELINYTGRQNLLAFSEGDKLERLGDLVGESRNIHTYAMTTLRFTLSTNLNRVHIIPKGTRVTADGLVYFEVPDNTEIPIGEKEIDIISKCTEPGSIGNNFEPGQINQIVDPIPFLDKVENITKSFGGMDNEADTQLRQRIHEAPEGLSTAGPDGAYLYHARRANPSIIDVSVITPSPGVVNLYPLLLNGELPTKEILEDVYNTCNDKKIRPLTDKLEVKIPNEIKFDLDIEYWISDEKKPFINQINKNVESAINLYKKWQEETLGRDINPDKLIELMLQAGAKRVNIKSPNFTSLNRQEKAKLINSNVIYKGVEDD